MPNTDRHDSTRRIRPVCKPYCLVGAGKLTSFVWKLGDPVAGRRFRFNILRLTAGGGRATQLFQPADLLHFVKLTQVLASTLADEYGLNAVDRDALQRLAADLDDMLTRNARQQQRPCNEPDNGPTNDGAGSDNRKESSHADSEDIP